MNAVVFWGTKLVLGAPFQMGDEIEIALLILLVSMSTRLTITVTLQLWLEEEEVITIQWLMDQPWYQQSRRSRSCRRNQDHQEDLPRLVSRLITSRISWPYHHVFHGRHKDQDITSHNLDPLDIIPLPNLPPFIWLTCTTTNITLILWCITNTITRWATITSLGQQFRFRHTRLMWSLPVWMLRLPPLEHLYDMQQVFSNLLSFPPLPSSHLLRQEWRWKEDTFP